MGSNIPGSWLQLGAVPLACMSNSPGTTGGAPRLAASTFGSAAFAATGPAPARLVRGHVPRNALAGVATTEEAEVVVVSGQPARGREREVGRVERRFRERHVAADAGEFAFGDVQLREDVDRGTRAGAYAGRGVPGDEVGRARLRGPRIGDAGSARARRGHSVRVARLDRSPMCWSIASTRRWKLRSSRTAARRACSKRVDGVLRRGARRLQQRLIAAERHDRRRRQQDCRVVEWAGAHVRKDRNVLQTTLRGRAFSRRASACRAPRERFAATMRFVPPWRYHAGCGRCRSSQSRSAAGTSERRARRLSRRDSGARSPSRGRRRATCSPPRR